MKFGNLNYQKIERNYLKFLKSQEVISEPFRDKLGQLKKFYLPISNMINKEYSKDKRVKIIGITGGQGSGKSTISNILKIILKEGFNLETVIFSIDDFYKTFKERKLMAEKVSPLFLTRGVPGTHDTRMLYNCINSLKKSKFNKIMIPKFDKSIDDRSSKSKWIKVNKKPHVVIFEGWCVGAKAQKSNELKRPVNELEKKYDQDLSWRRKVNNELKKNYSKIFSMIDTLIFLKVPSFNYVHKWRLLQEKKLKIKSKGKKIMNKQQIKTFIMHYERVTKNMLKDLLFFDVKISLDKKHKLKSIKFN